jgi:dTDP-4-amino-4,6-dideoxygalactose transaminase
MNSTGEKKYNIPVNRPFLPPMEKYNQLIQSIWKSNHLTNFGPLATRLEKELCNYLELKNVRLINNGTVAIQLALRALELKGSVITTPFSYVATTSSLVYEGLTPVFADIDSETLNIDPAAIEAAIRPDTTAILATHVYGNICDVNEIKKIADKNGLKVIYDAAHCFGTTYKGESAFAFGDIATSSFHATKVFHTVEGGAVFSESDEIMSRIFYLMNFGHRGYEEFETVGINGKNSEFHAAMGLINMEFVDTIIQHRLVCYNKYINNLKDTNVRFQKIMLGCNHNGSYMPVIFESESQMKKVREGLDSAGVMTRRYFYPSLNTLPYLKNYGKMDQAEDIASRILCLPLYYDLKEEEVDITCDLLIKYLN